MPAPTHGAITKPVQPVGPVRGSIDAMPQPSKSAGLRVAGSARAMAAIRASNCEMARPIERRSATMSA
jgi:hypothetical protein